MLALLEHASFRSRFLVQQPIFRIRARGLLETA